MKWQEKVDKTKEKKEVVETEYGKEEHFTPVVIYSGGCKHDFVFSNDEPNGLQAWSCTKCPNGILIDPKTHKVEGGKILAK